MPAILHKTDKYFTFIYKHNTIYPIIYFFTGKNYAPLLFYNLLINYTPVNGIQFRQLHCPSVRVICIRSRNTGSQCPAAQKKMPGRPPFIRQSLRALIYPQKISWNPFSLQIYEKTLYPSDNSGSHLSSPPYTSE